MDVNGEIAVSVDFYLALANGLVSFISTFATTGSLTKGLDSAFQAIVRSFGGKIQLAIDIYTYSKLLIDCLNKGLSWGESFLVIGIAVIGDQSCFQINDDTIKSVIKASKPALTAAFGTGKGLAITGITTGLQAYFQSDEIAYIPQNPTPSNIRNRGKSGHRGGSCSTTLYKAFGY